MSEERTPSTGGGSAAAEAAAPVVLEARGVAKTYRMGERKLEVLKHVDLSVRGGEWLGVLGRSGSGKSTLLHLLGGLDRPDAGVITFGGEDLTRLGSGALNRYRAVDVGFVFQAYHLLPELTALENVQIAARVGGTYGRGGKAHAGELLRRVGLGERLKHRPARLSGGERQRVAIARALVNRPAVLLADEPTGNLDAETGGEIMALFRELHGGGQTIVMVTHDREITRDADRVVELVGGELRV